MPCLSCMIYYSLCQLHQEIIFGKFSVAQYLRKFLQMLHTLWAHVKVLLSSLEVYFIDVWTFHSPPQLSREDDTHSVLCLNTAFLCLWIDIFLFQGNFVSVYQRKKLLFHFLKNTFGLLMIIMFMRSMEIHGWKPDLSQNKFFNLLLIFFMFCQLLKRYKLIQIH